MIRTRIAIMLAAAGIIVGGAAGAGITYAVAHQDYSEAYTDGVHTTQELCWRNSAGSGSEDPEVCAPADER